jgi:hypothetical protein
LFSVLGFSGAPASTGSGVGLFLRGRAAVMPLGSIAMEGAEEDSTLSRFTEVKDERS